MQHDNDGRMWSKTAEEGNPWLRLLSALRRDKPHIVRRTGFVPAQSGPGEAAVASIHELRPL